MIRGNYPDLEIYKISDLKTPNSKPLFYRWKKWIKRGSKLNLKPRPLFLLRICLFATGWGFLEGQLFNDHSQLICPFNCINYSNDFFFWPFYLHVTSEPPFILYFFFFFEATESSVHTALKYTLRSPFIVVIISGLKLLVAYSTTISTTFLPKETLVGEKMCPAPGNEF